MISSRKTASTSLHLPIPPLHTWNAADNIDNDDNKDKIGSATECDGRSDDQVTWGIIYWYIFYVEKIYLQLFSIFN